MQARLKTFSSISHCTARTDVGDLWYKKAIYQTQDPGEARSHLSPVEVASLDDIKDHPR